MENINITDKIKELENKRDSITQEINNLKKELSEQSYSENQENISKLIGKYFRSGDSDKRYIKLFQFDGVADANGLISIYGTLFKKTINYKGKCDYCFFESNCTLLSFPNFTTMDKILNFFHERYTEISKEEFDKYVKEMSDDFNAYARSPLPSREDSLL